MPRREARRVLVLAAAVIAGAVALYAWVHHAGRPPTPEEQAREKTQELKEKVKELTR